MTQYRYSATSSEITDLGKNHHRWLLKPGSEKCRGKLYHGCWLTPELSTRNNEREKSVTLTK